MLRSSVATSEHNMSESNWSWEEESAGKILIIDDEKMLRQSIVAHLDDSGFEAIEAEDGPSGLEKFRSEKPDCILTDIQMPGMKGLDLLSVIAEESPDTPVIVISGAGVMADAVRALRLGAWDYLIKPIPDLTVLEHAVCKCLERARLVEENKRYRKELESMNAKLRESLDILEEDQAAGRNVQTSLLPSPTHTVGEYTISHKIEPSLFLSGDFVDHFQINDSTFGFYIADVSGHGASSAFVTVLLKSLMNQLLTQYQTGEDDTLCHPDKVLAFLSQAIHEAKMGKYLTMVYSVLDLNEHTVQWSIGGHYPYPVMHNHDTDACDFWPEKGFPVGMLPNATYDKHEVSLPPNFTLAMFSDGVLEVIPDEELADKEAKLLSLVKEGGETVDGLFEKLQLENWDALPDDITLVLLHRGKGSA